MTDKKHANDPALEPPIIRRLTGGESLLGLSRCAVGDFWQWAYSDIVSNANRGVFAEFIVGAALGVLASPRVEWDSYDLDYQGKGIEVKSAAYIQSWQQKKLSPIQFSIGKKLPWDSKTGKRGEVKIRSAACYVFCLYAQKEGEAKSIQADILNIEKWWEFYILPAQRINDELGDGKNLGVGTLRKMTAPVRLSALKASIDAVLTSGV